MSNFHRSIPLMLLLALSGCGGSEEIELSEVKGVVTLDSKPLPNAVVTFTPKEGGPSGIGKTDANGQFQLMTAGKPGAVLGQHTVSIICVAEPAPVVEVSSDDPNYQYGGATSSADAKPEPVPEIPARYNSQTELAEEVTSEANTINFDLKS